MLYALIPLLPLLAFVVLSFAGHVLKERAHLIAVPAVWLSFLLSLLAFSEVAGGRVLEIPLYTWAASGDLTIRLGLYVDQLTAAMLLLVTIVSGLVHVYTIGYMHGEPGYARFFANIALFTFSMLMLVMSDNFVQLFVFWEAVGLCSYLLIGHWYDRHTARAAATKAFIVNRVGDFGFLLGILLVFVVFGTLQYQPVFAEAANQTGAVVDLLGAFGGGWEVSAMTLICLLLFVGAVGKSAQVPLHVWLPDAMEGPTPISALIHAATMVTAGVFMVARLAPLYNLSPAAMTVVAIVGGLTMIVGATIALTQNDIKRVVAYSTLSQLGYMMMACGLGGYVAGIYHLLTHGAFKALLFLGCGSVILAVHHEQDMQRMGGLKDKMPVTYWTFIIGSLALAGFPLTAGFFSKDELLLSAWNAGMLGQVLAVAGILTAGLTAFYSFRLVFVTFWGESRVDPHHADHVHEQPSVVTVPLLVLAVLSIVTGYLGIPEFLQQAFPGSEGAGHHGAAATGIMLAATLAGVLGIAAAYVLYVKSPDLPERLMNQWHALYRGSFNKWYVDEAYDKAFVNPTFTLADRMWKKVDVAIIDNAVNGVARGFAWWGWMARLIQTGETQNYALSMAMGAVIILTAYLMF
ncbi:MAG: NADH-quinone oxidoreductase subunit L [Nitrospira sp. SB0672_bin_25]|nr:NADH-quinone oxidoreductase subunit L [Nitrospira sp. SB0666_bin_27]MYF25221.1 NADH-quinone oxidoreductase subunit L [Nitrospira sp. SB0678_bin_10]MYJ54533.1 NADH-quinone oxidoreductase subunit L [Nitrospira sp. SB0672_bin_25]